METFGSIARMLDVEGHPMTSVSARYIVNDVKESIGFYTQALGFKVDFNPAPGFAALSRGELQLYLNAPGAGGAGQAVANGQKPEPGGWNRIQIVVDDLKSTVDLLKQQGSRFKSDIIVGQGGKQALLEDPSGNLIELFEPKQRAISPIPEGFHTVTPFLVVNDVAALIGFIERAFDGRIHFKMQSDDGVIRHATVWIGSSLVMLSSGKERYSQIPAMLHLYLDDVDRYYRQAIDAGGMSIRAPQNEFYGDRTAAVEDTFKNQWWIATHIEDVEGDELKRREAAFRSNS
jgi:uncharacterized glyoxalase superfamily protein PhnB/catechol 2,3-dioxygenase-like lactoylglutathione lyase family enzyme